MGHRAQWKYNCFHIFCSLPNIDFAAVIFCAESPYRCLFNRNQFSFVLRYEGVVIFIHKQKHSVCTLWVYVCVCVCVFLPWLLSRRLLQGIQGNHSSPVNSRGSYHGGEWEKQSEAGWVSACMIMSAHPVFICSIVGCHLHLVSQS